MAILFNNSGGETQAWVSAFEQLIPDMPVQVYPNADTEQIRYAVVWNHPPGDLKRYPNLRAILNLGAGTDYLEQDSELPNVPVVRLLDPSVALNMAQYALYWVMHFQRGYPQYQRQQDQRVWQRFQAPLPSEFVLTILGLGHIGQQIAVYLHEAGFTVRGWNRSPKQIAGIACFSDSDALDNLLPSTQVLVNMLPLTADTRGFLNSDVFSKLPDSAVVMNLSRGAVIDEKDLLEALDRRQLTAAVLDAVVEEPLPASSRLWSHPNVVITPHISGATYAETSAKVIAQNIQRLEQGEDPFPVYPPFQLR